MVRLVIAGLLLFSVTVKAQQPVTFLSVDSTTLQCYLAGDWNKLISVGKEAISQNIDYKRLRQRMGYAYFVKADYYAAQYQYEKALTFDEYDVDTRAYLYYCGLNTGNEAYARYYAQKLPKELLQKLKIKMVIPIDAIDFEVNYKSNNSPDRTSPTYFRAGINTQLGYRLSLYQSVSTYQQTIGLEVTKQPEYFVLLKGSLNSHITLDVAYHFLNTSVDGYKLPANLLFAAFSTKINRFSLGLNGSVLTSDSGNSRQLGLQAGCTLPGKSNIYVNSTVSGLLKTANNRVVFSQTAGGQLAKTVWIEGNVTLGNLLNYQDHNALYIYNSIDPTTFRTGFTLFWHTWDRVTLFGNFIYETKQILLTNSNYKQQSFSGGIIWKL